MAKRRANRVVSLRGAAIPIPSVNEEVVATAEGLLKRAKDGFVSGFVGAIVSPEGHIEIARAGNADRHQMVAAVAMLRWRVERDAFD